MIKNLITLTDYEKKLPHHEMIFVEGGEFDMGGSDVEARDNEKPVHRVRVSSFYIGKYPVTQALWQVVIGNNPSRFKGGGHPVENVSWDDAQIFIQKLNEKTGKTYRLPTEAEWEFAARGGLHSEGYLYVGSDKLKEVGWYEGNSGRETQPVGQKYPNELAIYDMSGNVWEWCDDWYSGEYYQKCAERDVVENPTGPENGSLRVLRGGSWFSYPRTCRVAYRLNASPGYRGYDLGFRLALSAPNDEK
ncbi:MAG: formylglycine-generating enzyme family protein [Bacteroidia bacterium]